MGGSVIKLSITVTFAILLIPVIAAAQTETPPKRVPNDVLKALGLDGLVAEPPEAEPSPQPEALAKAEGAMPIEEIPELVPLPTPPPPDLPERLTASLTMARPPELASPAPDLKIQDNILGRWQKQAKGGFAMATHLAAQTNVLIRIGLDRDIRAVATRTIATVDLKALQKNLERRLAEKDTAYTRSLQQLNASARRFETIKQELAKAQLDAEEKRRATERADEQVKQLMADFKMAAKQLRSADVVSKEAAKDLARFNRQSAASMDSPRVLANP